MESSVEKRGSKKTNQDGEKRGFRRKKSAGERGRRVSSRRASVLERVRRQFMEERTRRKAVPTEKEIEKSEMRAKRNKALTTCKASRRTQSRHSCVKNTEAYGSLT